MDIRIIFGNFLSSDGERYVIGGIETYIKNLGNLFSNMGHKTTVYQFSKIDFLVKKNGILVKGKKIKQKQYNIKYLIRMAEKDGNIKKDILIFASDYNIVKTKFVHTIAIQHGISWDIANIGKDDRLKNVLNLVINFFRTAYKYRRFLKCENIVCVDYNFINWYRTQIKHIGNHFYTIPNFAKIDEYYEKEEQEFIHIIFARRLVEYRGTRIFVKAIKRILKERKNICVTIAGEGPEKVWMKKELDANPNVSFICYDSDESTQIHKKQDIAVVPTLGSEGTSLSLLEAMSSGCAVIATNIGGMTNIILDSYNGLLINPNEEELYYAILKLVDNKDFRKKLAFNGYTTVASSFSLSKWENRWKEVIKKVTEYV